VSLLSAIVVQSQIVVSLTIIASQNKIVCPQGYDNELLDLFQRKIEKTMTDAKLGGHHSK
jgi:hypothetical protein